MTNMTNPTDMIEDATYGDASVGLLRDDNEDIEGLSSLYPNSALPLPTSSTMRMTTIGETNRSTVSSNNGEAETIGEGDLQLPLLSSFLDGWRFWWKFAQAPILFIMVNAIVMVHMEKQEIHPKEREYSIDENLLDPDFAKMRYKSIVLGILFLVDAAVLFRVALSTEKSVQALRRQKSNADAVDAPYTLTYVHARVSKMLDSFLSQGRSKLPEVSVFVNALYLAAGFCFVASAVSLALYWFLHTSKADTVCNSYHQTPTANVTIDGVPDALQTWAAFKRSRWRFDGVRNYAHMANGNTYFVASYQRQSDLNRYSNQVLFSTGPDGTLKSYPQILDPEQFSNMAGPSEDASEGFCCLYQNDGGRRSSQERKLLCILGEDDKSSPNVSPKQKGPDNSNGQLPKEMMTASLPFQENDDGAGGSVLHKSLDYLSLRAYDGILYLRAKWYIYNTRGRGGREAVQVDIYSLNPQTALNWTSVGTMKEQNFDYFQYRYSRRGERHRSPCFDSITTVATMVGAPLFFLMAYGLLIWRDIPAGMASFCIGGLAILSYVSEELAVGVGALASVVGATTLSLFGTPTKILPPWISRDMLLWGIYATIAVLALASPDFWCCWKWPVGRLCLAVVTGVVLDHPVLHIMGWMSAAVTLSFFCLSIWDSTTPTTRNSNDDGYDDGRNSSMWPAVPLGLVITCGLFSLSFSLRKSRLYLVVYSRRFWRILQLASRNASSSSRGGRRASSNNNDSVMMQSLLSPRDE
jgi:hypothetical protein